MTNLKKWAPHLSVILTSILASILVSGYPAAAETVEEPDIAMARNTYVCPLAGPGSPKIVVTFPDSVLYELAAQLKKKKAIPTGSIDDIPGWMGGRKDPGTGRDGHTGCSQMANPIKVSEICISSTYQCAYDRLSGKGTRFTGGIYHGVLTLNSDDLKSLTGGWDNLMGRFKKDGTLGTRMHDALRDVVKKRNYIPEHIEETLLDGTRQYPDPWQTSDCLKKLTVQPTYRPTELEALKTFNFSYDTLQEQCGEQEGQAAYFRQDKEIKKKVAEGMANPPFDSISQMQQITDCGRILDYQKHRDSDPLTVSQADCQYARACVPHIFANTCKVSNNTCNWNQCLDHYQKFCNVAGCLIGGKGSISSTSGSSSIPPFNMADVTGRALAALDKVKDNSDLMGCALRNEMVRTSVTADSNSEKQIKNQCDNDEITLTYLKTILTNFNNVATTGKHIDFDYRGSSGTTIETLRQFVAHFSATTQPVDSNLRASLVEISAEGDAGHESFLQWITTTGGAVDYLRHDHTTSTSSPPASEISMNSNDPGDIFKRLDNGVEDGAPSPVSCIRRYAEKNVAEQYMNMIKFDYRIAYWMEKFINHDCKNIGSGTVPKKSKSGK